LSGGAGDPAVEFVTGAGVVAKGEAGVVGQVGAGVVKPATGATGAGAAGAGVQAT